MIPLRFTLALWLTERAITLAYAHHPKASRALTWLADRVRPKASP